MTQRAPRAVRTLATTLIMTAALSGLPPGRMAAQMRPPAPPPRADENAEETRQRLREILAQYPPSLAQVLRLDPSLLTSQPYLAPYPSLAAFLTQHPDVAHNPAYFIGEPRFLTDSPQLQTMREVGNMAMAVGIFVFFMAALAVVAHIGRAVLEHRRWLHATKVQTEAHTKLVDRLASNEDLLAYIQSPAGQRFLAVSPMAAEPQSHALGAPIGRILGSLQIGVVLAFGGVGLAIAKNQLIDILAQPLHVIATVAIAVGVGFVISGLLSYGFSRQLGLIHSAPPPHA